MHSETFGEPLLTSEYVCIRRDDPLLHDCPGKAWRDPALRLISPKPEVSKGSLKVSDCIHARPLVWRSPTLTGFGVMIVQAKNFQGISELLRLKTDAESHSALFAIEDMNVFGCS
jgi:hypothetical protein